MKCNIPIILNYKSAILLDSLKLAPLLVWVQMPIIGVWGDSPSPFFVLNSFSLTNGLKRGL